MDRRYKKRIERYWSKMEKVISRDVSRIDPEGWFDLWHTHPDWDGKGNLRPENKARANEITFNTLLTIEELLKHRGSKVQCFAILKDDTMGNSVYIHSENPNSTEFPFKYDDVSWGVSNDELSSYVDYTTHEVGLFLGEGPKTYFVRKLA